jgi:hypothetical protein
MGVDFRTAVARQPISIFMPDLLFRLGADGQPVYREVAEAIIPGHQIQPRRRDFSCACSTALPPGGKLTQPQAAATAPAPRQSDYCVVDGREDRSAAQSRYPFDPGTGNWRPPSGSTSSKYLMRRADDWAAKGFYRKPDGFCRPQCSFQILG